MDSLCKELQRGEPPSDLGRSIKTGRSELETGENTQEVPPETQKQTTSSCETTKPQSCRLCAQAKDLQIPTEEAERRMRYPEISLFNSEKEEEKETYVFVWQTEDNRVAQTDLRESESKKNRKLAYLKHAVKNFLQVAWWLAVVL